MLDPMFSFERLCLASLNRQYGEFALLPDPERGAVTRDFADACREERELTVAEYKRRIGAGNLASYTACLMVQVK